MVTWTLAKKDLRILLRDPRAAIVLLVMPLLFTSVLGLLLGEGFGQKPDDRRRISVVNVDRGLPETDAYRKAMAWFLAAPGPDRMSGGVDTHVVGALVLARVDRPLWSQVVL